MMKLVFSKETIRTLTVKSSVRTGQNLVPPISPAGKVAGDGDGDSHGVVCIIGNGGATSFGFGGCGHPLPSNQGDPVPLARQIR